ncbi:hypothetical protein [Emticicia sp. TH156]|uniref:hypothetical protein n=1 Tax=Emticicia sp. TH156 TaxID=2067454 RepID=UPI000C78C906|nr:hypothetical protein [Emticicia sp. TH156]PLK42098.1 hypothetical protein C0V77_22685 [Emticicia sp. TH156]
MNKTIQLCKKEADYLEISLHDILSKIHDGYNYKWKILWIEAVTNPKSDFLVVDFEQKVKESLSGYLISWNHLLEMSKKIHQTIEVIIIGDKEDKKLKRYENDEDMRLSCNYCIELVDSSFWEISSSNFEVLQKLNEVFS